VRANKTIFIIAVAAFISMIACERARGTEPANPQMVATELSTALKPVVENAIEQTRYTISYDPAYVKLDYPGGDLPIEKGVCADVIIRAFRKGGIDLQKEIHEDMARNFSAYPNKWGLSRPDSNIDHRRVPNLMTYFNRKQKALRINRDPKDYLPGDVVAWDLGNGLLHIGIVVNRRSQESRNFHVVHNIGAGAKMEDVLFAWPIIGHYRYF